MDAFRDVACVKALQSKSRWSPEEAGYVPSGFRTRQRLRKVVGAAMESGADWVFVTLTYDPWPWMGFPKPVWWDEVEPGDSRRKAVYESDGFQAGCERCFKAGKKKRHTGEFFRRLRAKLGESVRCWRVVEFMRNGMVHHHVLVEKRFIEAEMVKDAWGWGRVDIKGIEDIGIAGYLTKYLTKGVETPRWIDEGCYSSALRMTYPTRRFWGEVPPVREDAVTVQVRRASPSIGEVKKHPERYISCMLQVIMTTGEVVHWRVPGRLEDVFCRLCTLPQFATYVERFGGMDWDGVGAWEFKPGTVVGEAALTLDLFLNCGALRGRDKEESG